ncbi:HAMP domain-containing sensor histidine kinase [Streptomyces sp. AC495_CC817]|uniref:sensor histidine kinase n=1 Tax=Streptomyces sp. AC495_CC817 TaxID=2823900 RepID=UPI0020B8A148|nr:HAMP domain-containing sensor histidine kinase [Streptomyces sp. AC495_CC817]
MTLRARITLGSTLIAVLLLGLASTVVFAQLSAVIAQKEKAVLHGITEVYRGAIEDDPGERFPTPGTKQHVAIVDPGGTVRMNTLPERLQEKLASIIAEDQRLQMVTAGGSTFTVYVDPVTTPGGTWYVVATRDADLAEDVRDEVTQLLVAVLVAAAAVFALGSWFVAGAALRPVERMRRSAQNLAVARDAELLPEGPERDELTALARTLNDLLERMRTSAVRERQMISDASHELRNPLAVLNAQLALVDGEDPASDEAAIADARRTASRLSRIADSLLQLSRIDADAEPGRSTLAATAGAVAEAVDRARLRVAEERPELTVDIDYRIEIEEERATVRIAADDFGRIVDNLVANAIAAAAGDLVILVRLAQHRDEAILTVQDDAGGFEPDVAARAFERFVRGQAADHPGGGLGLSIVARLAARAGGTAVISNSPGVGAEVVIALPAEPATRADADGDRSGDRSANTHHR